jgi:hypothetical protein
VGASGKSLAYLLIGVMLASSLLMVRYSSAQSTVKPAVPEFKIMLVKHGIDSWRTVDLVITNQNLPEQEENAGYGYNGLMFNVRFKDHSSGDWQNLSASNGHLEYFSGPYMPHKSGYQYTVFSLMLNNMRSIDSLSGNDIVQGGIQVPINSVAEFQVEALYGTSYKYMGVPFGQWVFSGQESGWSNTQSITINEADAVSASIYNPTITVTTPTPAPTPSPTPTPTTTSTPTPTSTDSNQKMDPITLPLTTFAAIFAVLALVIVGLAVLLYRRTTKPEKT